MLAGGGGRTADHSLRTLALSKPARARTEKTVHHAQGAQRARLHHRGMLTVLVTASPSPLNPSTAILRELLLSLRLLELPSQSPVLVSHDGPRLPASATLEPDGATVQFPSKYLAYLAGVEQLIPDAAVCTDLAIRLVVRATNGMLAGNIAFALSLVRTPYLLKVEHDHVFTRRVDVMSIISDMKLDPRLMYVRFNRRDNLRLKCDNGDFGYIYINYRYDNYLAKSIWGPHSPPDGVSFRQNYTRTSCFSDMNHLTSTRYYREKVLPVILRNRRIPPETLMQDHCWIARNHTYYGTYIYGGLGVPPTIAHVDAALRGVGELLPQVRTWLRDLHTRVRNGVGDPPFSCRSTINLTWTPRLGNGKGGGGRGG
jgi:hypothetical protein